VTLVARHSALSDIGLHRKTNEDTFVAAPPLFAVCDGMGGAQAGEVASGIAAETLAAEVAAGTPLREAAETANSAVHAAAADSARSGMGTTLTAMVLAGSLGHFVHVGDSRAYLLRGDELTQVSEDHSLVGEMMRDGQITREEAMVHPHRSVLTRVLGTEPRVELDEFTVELQAGDVLLFCSDGLSGPVSADTIVAALRDHDVETAARMLVDEALANGGPDNVTVVVVHLEGDIGDDEAGTTILPPATLAGQTLVVDQGEPSQEVVDPLGEPPSGRAAAPFRSRRRLGCLVSVLALLAVVGVAAAVTLSSVFFISVDEGRLAVYSGLPLEVGPIPLHTVYRSSGREYSSLSLRERELVDERSVRSRDEVMQLASDLEMWP
jgi:protein phosphatase